MNKAGLDVLRMGLKEATVEEAAETSPAAAEFLGEMACLGLIELSDSPMDPLGSPRPPEPGLRLAWLELTSRCNLRCVHCYEEAGDTRREEMPREEWERVVSELAALGCSAVQLTGGEPLLRDDVLELTEHASSRSSPMPRSWARRRLGGSRGSAQGMPCPCTPISPRRTTR